MNWSWRAIVSFDTRLMRIKKPHAGQDMPRLVGAICVIG
jgi:hypothetical protein